MKGRTYGTLIVNLERRQVVDLLANRSAASTAVWFSQHPEIEIVSRNRCGIYAQSARQGAPQARQVADRFHLLQNLRDAVEQQLSRAQTPSMPIAPIDEVAGSQPPVPAVEHRQPRRSRAEVQRDDVTQFRRAAHQLRFDQVKALQDTGVAQLLTGWSSTVGLGG